MEIKTEHLLPALDILLPIAGKRTTLPILSCFKLESDGETLTVTASDIDQFAQQKVECIGKLDACCVNANKFVLLSKSGTDKITIQQAAGVLKITANGTANLKTLPAEEFFPLPADKQIAQGCHCADLADCVETVAFAAAAPDEARFFLQHIYVSLEPKKMQAQSSNARVIASCFKPSICGSADLLCHTKFAGIFCQYLRSENATLSIGKSYFSVKYDSGIWFGKLPEEKWPVDGTNNQLKAKTDKIGTVSVEVMRGSIGLAFSLVKESPLFSAINLSFTGKTLRLSCADYQKEILGSFSLLETRMDLKILSMAFRHLKSDETTVFFGSEKLFLSDGSLDLVLATLNPEIK